MTLLPRVTIGREACVGADTVIRKSIPPYSVVMGNPQMIIGFNLSPAEILSMSRVFILRKNDCL